MATSDNDSRPSLFITVKQGHGENGLYKHLAILVDSPYGFNELKMTSSQSTR